MAQFDLILTQNTHATLTEFTEKIVNIAKGGLLSADVNGVPTILAAGTDGYMLVRDAAEATGLKWVAISAGHTQGTDNGTTATIFELDSDGYKIELTAESASKMGVKVDGGATYADFQAKDITCASLTVGGSGLGTMATASTSDYVVKALFDANTILYATTDNTPAALTVGEQTIIGRKTGGAISALTPAEIMNIIWVTAPASKTASGVAGQLAKDGNYLYICTATNVWARSTIATNW